MGDRTLFPSTTNDQKHQRFRTAIPASQPTLASASMVTARRDSMKNRHPAMNRRRSPLRATGRFRGRRGVGTWLQFGPQTFEKTVSQAILGSTGKISASKGDPTVFPVSAFCRGLNSSGSRPTDGLSRPSPLPPSLTRIRPAVHYDVSGCPPGRPPGQKRQTVFSFPKPVARVLPISMLNWNQSRNLTRAQRLAADRPRGRNSG